jgi:hypothetical protein
MSTISQVRSIGGRLALSLLGASFTAMGAAVLDASWARAPGEATRQTSLAIYLADAGLIAPIALGLGLFAGVVGLILDPAFPPSPLRLAVSLRARAVGRPADVAAFVPLTVLGAFFWMTLSAHLARALLALSISPGLTGVAIATGALGIGRSATPWRRRARSGPPSSIPPSQAARRSAPPPCSSPSASRPAASRARAVSSASMASSSVPSSIFAPPRSRSPSPWAPSSRPRSSAGAGSGPSSR